MVVKREMKEILNLYIVRHENNNVEKKKNQHEKLKLQKLNELNEIYFGKWQGMSFKEIFVKYPEEAHNYFYDVKNYCAKNVQGEELRDGLERFLQGLNKITEQNSNGNILVITHGTVLELFFNYIENKKSHALDERKLIGNGEYKIFVYKNGKYTMK